MEPTNESNSTNKTCTKCKQEQSVAAFSKGKHSKDGLQSKCKKCDKTWREDNKEKLAASDKAWREYNKEKCKAQQKAWREANPGKKAAGQKAWRDANKGYLEARRIERRANRGDIPSLEIYGLPDRESVKQVRTDKLAIFRKFFGKGKYHLDHMRPLAGAKGDTEELHKRSHFSNLVYIPASENLSKNAKPFWEWFATLKDQKLKKCIALQDAYNRAIERAIAC